MIDYDHYHPNFKKISHHVRFVRARGRCERCGVRHASVGHWEQTRPGQLAEWIPLCGDAYADDLGAGYRPYGEALGYVREYNRLMTDVPKLVVIKLACAHLDRQVDNNEDDNLQSMCQRCHRRHDSADNAERRKYGETGQHRDQLRLLDDSPYARHPERPREQKPVRQKRKYVRKRTC